MSTSTYIEYWTALLGARSASQVREEFWLDISDRRGQDEWLGTVEVETWILAGGSADDLPPEWADHHAAALQDLACV